MPKDESAESPVSMQIELSPAAKRIVERIKNEVGSTRIKFIERLLEWVALQSVDFRSEIIKEVGDPTKILIQKHLASIHANGGDAVQGEVGDLNEMEAIQRIRSLLNRVENISRSIRSELDSKPPKKKS